MLPARRSRARVREAGTVLGTQRGEIPAASAGMTGLSCAGVTELFCVGVMELFCVGAVELFLRGCGGALLRSVASEGVGGGDGAWCAARRDTRGERGYDGALFARVWRSSFCVGVAELFCVGVVEPFLRGDGERGCGRRGRGLALSAARYPRRARV